MKASAPTLAYDSEIMGNYGRGGTVPTDVVGAVAIPTLVGRDAVTRALRG